MSQIWQNVRHLALYYKFGTAKGLRCAHIALCRLYVDGELAGQMVSGQNYIGSTDVPMQVPDLCSHCIIKLRLQQRVPCANSH